MSDSRESREREGGTFEGTSRDDVSGGTGTTKGTFLSDDNKWATLRDRVFVAVAIAAIITMALTSVLTIKTNAKVDEVNRQQVAVVKLQNDAQLCAQHDIVLAVRQIGRKLGLPVSDIIAPDVTGLECR
jgi:hypothetical protein